MPIYEYQCRKCKAHLEVLQKVTDKPPAKCRKCGGRFERVASAPAIQFKGSGWYVTDYGGKSKSDKPESESAGGDDKKSEKSEKKTKESSPAKKTSEKASPPKAPSAD